MTLNRVLYVRHNCLSVHIICKKAKQIGDTSLLFNDFPYIESFHCHLKLHFQQRVSLSKQGLKCPKSENQAIYKETKSNQDFL